jgi:hypothetical protein
MQEKTNIILKGILKSLLVMSPALFGFGIILFSQGPIDDVTFGFGLFVAGFTGVIVAVRKEIPISIGSTRRKWAVIQGIGFVALLWGSALLILLI